MGKTGINGGKKVNAGTITKSLRKEFGKKILEISLSETPVGKKKTKASRIWMSVKPEDFKSVVKYLFKLQEFPHFSVSSGFDAGKEIEIINHFTLNYGHPGAMVLLNIRVRLPKKKPEMDTITDLIPGAWVAEKEKQEFLGVKIKGIEPGRLFLDDSLPKGVYPWRKDSKGAGKHAINVRTGDSVD